MKQDDEFLTTDSFSLGESQEEVEKPEELDEDEFLTTDGIADTSLIAKEEVSPPEDTDLVYGEKTHPIKSGLIGTAQGLTFDFADEGLAGMKAYLDYVMGDNNLKENYEKYRDEIRKEFKKAEYDNPTTYKTADIGSGIIPALFTGGASLVGSIGKTVAKEATKGAAKQVAKGAAKKVAKEVGEETGEELAESLVKQAGKGALIGSGQGAVTGLGMSEADLTKGEVGQALKDTLTGAAAGAVGGAAIPMGLKGAGKAASSTWDKTKKAANFLTGGYAKKAYDYRLKGKPVVGQEAAKSILKEAYDTVETQLLPLMNRLSGKAGYRLKSAFDEMKKSGNKKNIDNLLDNAEKQLKEIMDSGTIATKEQEEFANAVSNLINKNRKQVDFVKLEDFNKIVDKAKNKVKDKVKLKEKTNPEMKYDEIQEDLENGIVYATTKADKQKSIEDAMSELQLKMAAKQNKLKELGETVSFGKPRISLKDNTITVADTTGSAIQQKIKPTGENTIAVLLDDFDNVKVSKMPIKSDLDALELRKLNKASGELAEGKKGSLVNLLNELRKGSKQSIEELSKEAGPIPMLNYRKANRDFSQLYDVGELLGNKSLQNRKKLSPSESIDLANKFFEIDETSIGSSATQKAQKALEMLNKISSSQSEGVTSKLKDIAERVDLAREGSKDIFARATPQGVIDSVLGSLRSSGLKVGDAAARFKMAAKNNELYKSANIIRNLPDETLNKVANRMVNSNKPGVSILGRQLKDAVEQEGAVKNALIWSLSQQPAFRSAFGDLMDEGANINSPEINKYIKRPEESEELEENQPQANANPYAPILDIISEFEGTTEERSGRNPYDVTLGYGAYDPVNYPVSEMTLDQLDKFQTAMLQHPNNKENSSAVGRYQITRTTLRDLRNRLGLSGDEKFTPELQDKLAIKLLGNIEGKSPKEIQAKAARIWASVPSPETGKSYYGQRTGGSGEDFQEAVNEVLKNTERVIRLRGSGDDEPLAQQEDLLESIENLGLNEQDRNEVENIAMNATSSRDTERLRELLSRLG